MKLTYEEYVINDNFTLRDLRSKNRCKNSHFTRMLVCSILLDYKIANNYREVSKIIDVYPDSVGRIFRKYKQQYRYSEEFSLLQLELLERTREIYEKFLILEKPHKYITQLKKENRELKEQVKNLTKIISETIFSKE